MRDPSWFTLGICFLKVKPVRVDVQRKQGLDVKVMSHEGGVSAWEGHKAASSYAHHNRGGWCGHRVEDFEIFFMFMTSKSESDNMLVTVHQGSESDTPLMLASRWVDVCNDEGCSSIGFNLIELVFKPCVLVSCVISLIKSE